MPFFLINKPKGVTSRAVTSKIQYELQVKAGHVGTLDPFATGLLIIATAGDTRLIDKFAPLPKTYVGRFIFGQTSSTLDPEGEIKKQEISNIEISNLETILETFFLGKIVQIPPQYSATKINGKRAYSLARENKIFELKPVERKIFSFKILKQINNNTFDLEFTVSNGTYIRALARDIAEKLGTVGMLLELERTKIGPFLLSAASPFSPEFKPTKNIYSLLNLEEIQLQENEIKRLLNGQEVKLPYNIKECLFENKETILLCSLKQNGNYKIKKRIN